MCIWHFEARPHLVMTTRPRFCPIALSLNSSNWGARKLMGDSLKVIYAEFSTLSWAVLLLCMKSMTYTPTPTSRVGNLNQGLSLWIKFVNSLNCVLFLSSVYFSLRQAIVQCQMSQSRLLRRFEKIGKYACRSCQSETRV